MTGDWGIKQSKSPQATDCSWRKSKEVGAGRSKELLQGLLGGPPPNLHLSSRLFNKYFFSTSACQALTFLND